MSKEYNIDKYFNDTVIILQTAEQIKKDFVLFDFPIHFSGNPSTAYDELFEQVRPAIQKIANSNIEKFNHLLYRIDIPENDLKEVYKINSQDVMYDVLTNLILKREMMKVCYRHYFKNL
jgi:hypothetical protein